MVRSLINSEHNNNNSKQTKHDSRHSKHNSMHTKNNTTWFSNPKQARDPKHANHV